MMNLPAFRHLSPLNLALVATPLWAVEPISTDRPDFVESSLVVGRGVLQVETSLAYERADTNAHLWATPTLLRLGVNENLELRLETDGIVSAQDGASPTFAETDVADLSLGMKWHHLDGGEPGNPVPSTAWLLHVDLPTGGAPHRGEHVTPSLRWVAEWELAEGWSLGMMPGLAWSDDGQGGRTAKGIFGLVAGRELAPALRGFAELALPEIARREDGGTLASLNTGLAWSLGLDTQLDTAIRFGLNKDSPDWAATLGLSHRFR